MSHGHRSVVTQAAGLTVSGPRLYQHSSLVHGMPMTLRTTTGWASGMLLYYNSPQLLLLNFQVSQGSRIAATFTSHAGGDGQHGASSSRQHHTQVLACQMSLPACGLSQAQRRQWRQRPQRCCHCTCPAAASQRCLQKHTNRGNPATPLYCETGLLQVPRCRVQQSSLRTRK